MTRAGKKALRDVAEEAQRRRIERKEKNEEERKQRSAILLANPVAESPTDPEKYFWTPSSAAEKNRMTTAANSIYKLAQKFEDDNADVVPSMLVLARDSLPAALKLLRMPVYWELGEYEELDGEYDEMVENTMKMLCSLAPIAGVRLSRDEISDIWAITNLLFITESDQWDVYWKKQYEELIRKCFLSEGIEVLAEIAQQDGHLKGVLCYDFLARIVNNDCSSDDILRICAAYTHVLRDPRTDEWTNGFVYSAIFDVSNHLRFVQILCDNVVEPARKVAVDNNVYTEFLCECDFPLLLLRLSKALATAKARTAAGLTCDQLGCLDDDDKNDGVECKLPTSEEWSFFLDVFERNSDGISMCDCPVKEPQLRCDFNKMAAIHDVIDELFLRIEGLESGSENLLNEAVISANRILTSLRDRAMYDYIPDTICNTSNYSEYKGKKKALLLRGKAYRAMGRFNDALDDFDKSSFHYTSSRIDKLQMEASWEAIQTLRDMKQYKTAIDQAKKLLEANVEECMIEVWKTKIRGWLVEIAEDGEIDVPSAPAVIVEGEVTSLDVDFAVAHCSWKQIGIKDEYIYWAEVQMIPRLRWVLARVRDDILVWDYDKEEVVHFITLDQPDRPERRIRSTSPLVVDMPDLNAVIYFQAFEKEFSILNLQSLAPRGGRTDVDDLTLPIALKAGDLCGRTYAYFLENATRLYSNVASIATSKDDSGQWRLALSHVKRCGVSIYKADRIRTGTLLGPFLITGERSFEIAGNASLDACEVGQMQMIGSGSLLVTVALSSKKIHVWDALGPQSSGTCLQVIRREVTCERSLCCSKSLLFTISQKQKDFNTQRDYNHLLEISVWALRTTTDISDHTPLVCSPARAILKNPPNLSPSSHTVHPPATYYEQQLAVLPQSSLLVSSHGDGTVNIWRYDDDAAREGETGPVAVHLRTFLTSPGHQFDYRFLLASPTSPAIVYMADTFTLFALDLSTVDATSREAGEEMCVRDRRLRHRAVVQEEMGDGPKLLNCFTCGKWDVGHSLYCGNCKSVSFCGPDCLKKGWLEHKEECQKDATS